MFGWSESTLLSLGGPDPWLHVNRSSHHVNRLTRTWTGAQTSLKRKISYVTFKNLNFKSQEKNQFLTFFRCCPFFFWENYDWAVSPAFSLAQNSAKHPENTPWSHRTADRRPPSLLLRWRVVFQLVVRLAHNVNGLYSTCTQLFLLTHVISQLIHSNQDICCSCLLGHSSILCCYHHTTCIIWPRVEWSQYFGCT